MVPVPDRAAALIDALPRIDARILPYNPDSVSAAFDRACVKAGIEDLRFHDLRHEGISRLFAEGLEIQEVALISGHQSWTMLRRYTHITPEAVVEKLRRTKAHNDSHQKVQEAAAQS
ncbi:tyrosine-type recombinase/integrase [bacterium]|nr:tyrosine-type recombinase/integrase [bacterium]